MRMLQAQQNKLPVLEWFQHHKHRFWPHLCPQFLERFAASPASHAVLPVRLASDPGSLPGRVAEALQATGTSPPAGARLVDGLVLPSFGPVVVVSKGEWPGKAQLDAYLLCQRASALAWGEMPASRAVQPQEEAAQLEVATKAAAAESLQQQAAAAQPAADESAQQRAAAAQAAVEVPLQSAAVDAAAAESAAVEPAAEARAAAEESAQPLVAESSQAAQQADKPTAVDDVSVEAAAADDSSAHSVGQHPGGTASSMAAATDNAGGIKAAAADGSIGEQPAAGPYGAASSETALTDTVTDRSSGGLQEEWRQYVLALQTRSFRPVDEQLKVRGEMMCKTLFQLALAIASSPRLCHPAMPFELLWQSYIDSWSYQQSLFGTVILLP